MSYPLSASRLQAYQRCPQAYYFQYERKMNTTAAFGAVNFGTALHQTLAQVYGEWHYNQPMPWAWVQHHWQQCNTGLKLAQQQEGETILQRYYAEHLNTDTLRRPLAVEGRIQAKLQIDAIEFTLTGRYDRLDWAEAGLALIDYKSAKSPQIPDADTVDVQLGLYYLALEQTYHRSLQHLSLMFLRTGESVTFLATEAHRAKTLTMIHDLALKLYAEDEWQPHPGTHCQRCSYQRYCAAVTPAPEPLPSSIQASVTRSLQLSLCF